MINKLNFWGSNYYNNPSIKEETIDKAEKILGIKLPSSFIDLIKIQNSGYTKGFVFPTKIKTSWADNHVPLNVLFGIVLDEDFMDDNIMSSNYMVKEWGLPEKLILISGDGHCWIALDYRKGKTPSISWIDIECNEDIKIAENFDDFLTGLVSEEEFFDN